jgi:hypothetical protein
MAIVKDDKLAGVLGKNLDASRRNVQNKNHFIHPIALGIAEKYPDLDVPSIKSIVEAPTLLVNNEFLEEIQSVHKSVRAPLINFMSRHVK